MKEFDDIEIIYADTNSEHPDNMRFLRDCETKLFGRKVTIVKSKKYNNIFEVFEARRFLASPHGAPCTSEMKKIPIQDYLGVRLYTEAQVMGFDSSEGERIKRYRANNEEVNLHCPLYEENISKAQAMQTLKNKGIDLPVMYHLGFSNANCIGCVKAESLEYWASVKKHFPDTFNWYAKFERVIGAKENGKPRGCAINKRYIKGERHRVFLDEIPESTKADGQLDFWCGYSCG